MKSFLMLLLYLALIQIGVLIICAILGIDPYK